MTRTKTIEGQALWQPGGAKEDSCFRESNGHLHQVYEEEEVLFVDINPFLADSDPDIT